MPKTGPREGLRDVIMTFLLRRASPWVSPMAVTVLPSPEAVGEVAVTRMSLPRRLNWGSSSSSRRTLPLVRPSGSKYSSGILSLRATSRIGRSVRGIRGKMILGNEAAAKKGYHNQIVSDVTNDPCHFSAAGHG